MKAGTWLAIFIMVLTAALCVVVLAVAFNPHIQAKAGPDWFWRFGKYDLVRALFFKKDGSFRRNGRAALVAIVGPSLMAALSILGIIVWAIAVDLR